MADGEPVLKRRGDRFSKQVAAVLERRAGQRCSICRCPTGGPHSDPTRSVSIGVAAHITAASPGGPRYDSELSPAERRSAENGIWACQNDGHRIDTDLQAFGVEELRRLKQRAEKSAQQGMGVPVGMPSALSSPHEQAEVRLLEQQRSALQTVFGEQIPEVHAILNLSVSKAGSAELLLRARPVHEALDRAAGLFSRESESEVHDALQELGQWVGTWPSPAWPIRQVDFDRFQNLTRSLRRGRDEIERKLTPRPPVDPRVLDLLDAVGEWFGALLEFRDLSPAQYELRHPIEVLKPLEARFAATFLRAQPVLPDSLEPALGELRGHMYAVDRHASTRPRPDLQQPGVAERSQEKDWQALQTAYKGLVTAARKLTT